MERTLSQNESKVVLDLEWHGQKTLTLAELRKKLGASEGYARTFAHRLVKKGWLEPLRRGLYQFVPAERGREGIADAHPLTAGTLLVDPYFYSFGTACTHYGLTEQAFAEVYLACQVHRRPEMIRGKRYVFVYVTKKHFFGFEPTVVLGETVKMAKMERALLDAVDRPKYAGGIGEVSRIVARAAPRISWEVMFDFLRKWESSALAQRLGYFLDLHGVDLTKKVRKNLSKLILPQSKIQLGPRQKWGTAGKLIQPWNVIENVPREVLLPKEEKTRRRVIFSKKGRNP